MYICMYVVVGGGGGGGGGAWRGYSQKSWVGVCGPFPKTLTLFMTPHPPPPGGGDCGDGGGVPEMEF